MKTNQTRKEAEGQFRSQISLTQAKFDDLLQVFAPLVEEKLASFTLKGKPRNRRLHRERPNGSLHGSKAKLEFILMYLKENANQAYHGFAFGLSQSKVSEWVYFLFPVLEQRLEQMGVSAQRDSFKIPRQREIAYLIADVTERKVPRKTDPEAQRLEYSGKKKCHTIKNLAITDPRGYVLFMSDSYGGSVHDKVIWDELEIERSDHKILADLGFLGIEKNYPNAILPFKKPKKGELSQDQKEINKDHSRLRIKVEHSFGGIKRLKMIRNTIRLKTEGIRDTIMRIATGLHNLRLAY